MLTLSIIAIIAVSGLAFYLGYEDAKEDRKFGDWI